MPFTKSDIINIVLGVYGIISTIGIISLSIYTYRVRKRCHCRTKSQSDISEDMRKLHRTSELNTYEVDSPPPFRPSNLQRTLSVPISPIKSRLLSEYDSTNCKAVPHNPLVENTDKRHIAGSCPEKPRVLSEYDSVNCTSVPHRPPLENAYQCKGHHYEEVDNAKNCPRAYEIIISQVVSSLSEIYNEKPAENDIYGRFMNQLMTAIKTKHKPLYESLQRYSVMDKHQYEEIKEPKEVRDTSEDDYACYIPTETDMNMAMKSEGKTNTLFGSNDHLKFLKESKNLLLSEKDAPYLEARQFIPTPNCPEKLKELCKNQNFLSRSRTLPPGTQHEEAQVSFLSPSSSGYFSSELSNCDSLSRNEILPKTARKIGKASRRPPVPPKNRSYSSPDEEPFF